jgi:hypothetical protein
MGDMSKGRPDPNATIELGRDALDQVELIDNDQLGDRVRAARSESARLRPPPLPSPSVATAPPARRGSGRTTVYALLLFAVVAAAIAAGLLVGSRMRGESPRAASPAASGASPPPAAGPSASTLVLPTVEISKP